MLSNSDIVDKEAIKTFAGMKVLVFGLGILGGGVAAANWLIRHGARVTVTDLKTEVDLADSLNKLEQPVNLKLGGHDDEDIQHCDLVLFNPDIPVRSPYVTLAQKLNKRVENEATLFYWLCRLPIIAVTGTRGKTTTCAWIEHFLNQRFMAVPAGNSPDNPFMHTLQVLEDAARDREANSRAKARIVVNELPSYHLEYFEGMDRSPDVAVVTNIFQDHLNRHTSMQEYVDTKANIFRHQTMEQSLILNHNNPWTAYLGQQSRPSAIDAFFNVRTSHRRCRTLSTKTIVSITGIAAHQRGESRGIQRDLSNDGAGIILKTCWQLPWLPTWPAFPGPRSRPLWTRSRKLPFGRR